jgi:hypothetical protein
MMGLHILKHTFNLSDEEVCERWVENLAASLVNSIDGASMMFQQSERRQAFSHANV